MSWLLDASLLSGVLPALLTAVGVAALVFLCARRSRRWFLRVLPLAVGAAGVLVPLIYLGLAVWKPFPDELPAPVLLWSAFGLLGLVVGLAHTLARGAPRAGSRRQAGAVVAVLMTVTVAAMQVNAVYGYRPTLRAALGLPAADEVSFTAIGSPAEPTLTVAPGEPLWRAWSPPSNLPNAGVVTQVDIPGDASRFTARRAEVYLPPAYLGPVRPALPVLVLISGQPGSPRDWMVAGRVAATMDAFAAAHGGLAPVVVVPDGTGTALANPLCMDSTLGNVETYLSADVPNWIRGHLQVDQDTRHWAVGGFSYGGTCALQLALRRPALFPTYLDIGGQQEPTLGGRARTVQAAFGGDETRFRAVNPLDLLATVAFPDSAGVLAAGLKDTGSGRENERVAAAAVKADMWVRMLRVPGAHSWVLASDALRIALPWLAERAGLAPPTEHPELTLPGAPIPRSATPPQAPPSPQPAHSSSKSTAANSRAEGATGSAHRLTKRHG